MDQKLLAISLIHRPLMDAVAGLRSRLLKRPQKWEIFEGTFDTSLIYETSPQRGGRDPLLAALWAPESLPGWTAFMSNSADGWHLLVSRLAKKEWLGDVLSIRSSDTTYIDQVQEIIWYSDGHRSIFQAIEEEGHWAIFKENLLDSWKSSLPRRILTRDDIINLASKVGVDLCDVKLWQTSQRATFIRESRDVS